MRTDWYVMGVNFSNLRGRDFERRYRANQSRIGAGTNCALPRWPFSPSLDGACETHGPWPFPRCPQEPGPYSFFAIGLKMIDTEQLGRLAETYSTQADYRRHMAEEPDGAFDELWVLLAAAWTELAEETKARSRGSRPN